MVFTWWLRKIYLHSQKWTTYRGIQGSSQGWLCRAAERTSFERHIYHPMVCTEGGLRCVKYSGDPRVGSVVLGTG